MGGGMGCCPLQARYKKRGGRGEGGGAVRCRPDTKSGGGVEGGCCPLQARYEKRRGGAVHLRPDTKSGGGGGGGGGGGVLSGASGPIQKAGKWEGLFSRRGGVTIYERGGGGCNPNPPPPPPPPPLDPPLV